MDPLTDWLEAHGLARYAEPFAAQDIGLDVLPELTEADLKELGVASLGDRKRLLKAIATLAAPPAAPAPAAAADAERRQLTVMFCDMVGSTQLATRLDPEDLQRVVREHHAAVAAAVAAYEGHVAQLLGDGVLVYFGYPRAHEDDAERAVRAALEVRAAVARLAPLPGVELATRVGIATGRVVVGAIGAGELTASGSTPNLAARLQAAARPGEIVVADETRRLLGASFELASAGALELKGFAAPVAAWRVAGERSVASRFEAQHDEGGLVGFVGRDAEVALLAERWALAEDGEGQVVLLAGEAGIGKSRIVHTLRERLPHGAATVLLQCSPYFAASALHPVVQYFERVAHIAPGDDAAQRTARLAQLAGGDLDFPARSFGYLLRLMGLPDGGRIAQAAETPAQENAALLQAPIDLLRALSRHHPVLLLIEDAHWIDPTTEELVALAIEQLRDARVLVLITCRPEYRPSWGQPSHVTRLTLSRLGQRQCAALVAEVTGGKPLPAEVLAEIVRKTDGIPLFVEELTKTVVQSGLLEDTPAGWRLSGPLPALAIPSTLQDSLMARLDRLAPAKEVAQVGAVIGREFSRRLLAAVLDGLPAARLDEALAELVRAELVVRRGVEPDVAYIFKHALIGDTAAQSMVRSQWVLRHAQVAEAIERIEPDTARTRPELLAHHWEQGGREALAFDCWSAAGELALARGAHREAASHVASALALLPRLGRADADATELTLRLRLGTLLMQTEGYAAARTVQCLSRARELAQALGQTDTLAIACSALGASLLAAGRYADAVGLLEPLVEGDTAARLAPMSRVFCEVVLGLAAFHLGQLRRAAAHSERADAMLHTVATPERMEIGGIDPEVMVMSQRVGILVHQGRLDEADALTRHAIELADATDREATRGWALGMGRWLAFRRGEHAESVRLARASLALSERLGFESRIATGLLMLGRALVAAGEVDEGRRRLDEGWARREAAGAVATGTESASHAAEVLLAAGCVAEAARFVHEGTRVQEAIGERFYEAELLRQRGRLAELGHAEAADDGTRSADARAEALYRQAIDAAEREGARWFTLRAANDLAALLLRRDRAAEAGALLRPVADAFDQGADYPERRRARELLERIEANA
ncbi:MAG TPA: adenylate/guanylate cyclase domain-containing protein [Burkholderiaceae bacterium]